MINFNTIEELKDWVNSLNTFTNKGGLTSKVSLLLKKNKDLLKNVQEVLNCKSSNPSELMYRLYNSNFTHTCEICGKETEFCSFTSGYKKSCSKECAFKLTSLKGAKHKLEKHGSSTWNNSNKAKETKLEKYGDSGFVNSEKAKLTKLEKYGDINFNNSNKAKETSTLKYGVDNPAKSEEIKEKTKQTLLMKYGCESPMQSEIIKQSYKDNFIKNHGCEWPQQNPDIHRKTLSNYGMTSPENKLYNLLKNRNFNFETSYECNGKNFDFVIFKEGQLSILVEVDGKYFHGLLSDSDGVNVRGDTDGERFIKCPEGVKFIVCDENNIESCFSEILEVFDISYKDWLQRIIEMLPKDFPYPQYSEDRMKKDYQHLCEYDYKKNQKLALSTINNFHKSIWNAHRKNLPSPYEAWFDKKLLEKCVKNRFIYASKLSTQNILKGFNICKIAPRISVFNPSIAKYLIDKYLSDYNEIFDPFSGFSGRLLGTCASNKKYIGQDINEEHIKESQEIIDFHNLNAEVNVQDILTDINKQYECLFTCSPYGGKEHWNVLNDEVEKSCDEWIDICLEKYDCKSYLFVVDKTNKYKKYIVETINNKSHFGENKEYVILINKPLN